MGGVGVERDCLAPGGSDCEQGWSLQRQERLEEAGEEGERVEDWEEEEKGVGKKRKRGIGWKEEGRRGEEGEEEGKWGGGGEAGRKGRRGRKRGSGEEGEEELISSLEGRGERTLPRGEWSQEPFPHALGRPSCPSEALPGLIRACDVCRPSIMEMSLF